MICFHIFLRKQSTVYLFGNAAEITPKPRHGSELCGTP